jgi:ubiquinone/menaquinone biosynthesis C-methylase UbiE
VGFPRRELRAAYDRDASDYEQRFAAIQAPKIEAVLQRCMPQPTDRVVDLGCGTGLLARALPPLARPVLALDLSAGMLRAGDLSGAQRVQADLARLPLRDGCLDLAYAITSLLGERGQVLGALLEVRRVLRPGGRLALTLLQSELWEDVALDLRACGLSPGEAFTCGQDRGWICRRA